MHDYDYYSLLSSSISPLWGSEEFKLDVLSVSNFWMSFEGIGPGFIKERELSRSKSSFASPE